MSGRSWLERPVAALCLLLALSALAAALLSSDRSGKKRSIGGPSYAVTIRHYGVEGREMERAVGIPLEDALYGIRGVSSVSMVSENGKVRALVRFRAPTAGAYEAVRDAAERVYGTLPRSVQRPEFSSSDDSRIPLWSAAVFARAGTQEGESAGLFLERRVKPALERIDGAGEVEISGTGLVEITVALDGEAAAARFLDAAAVAAALASDDLLLPGGALREGEGELLISVDGRYADLRDLAAARIPLRSGGSASLSDVAALSEGEREPDIRARLDGNPAAVVSVMGASGADMRALSDAIRRELDALSHLPLEFLVLSDRGAEEAAAANSVFSAALQGALAVALVGALLSYRAGAGSRRRRLTSALVGAAAVPCIALLSAALLAASGFPIDRMVLAGLAAGLGAAVDAAILGTERLLPCRTAAQARAALASLAPSLLSGTATTVVVLLPLASLDGLSGSVNSVASAVGACSVVSLFAALVLLPPLLLSGAAAGAASPSRPKRSRRRLEALARLTALPCAAGVRRPWIFPLSAFLLSFAGILALLAAGADVSTLSSEDTVYAQAEFPGGLCSEAVDAALAEYAAALRRMEGIRGVQTGARVGSGSILISFDPKRLSAPEVAAAARDQKIPGAFVYLSEAPGRERVWTITVAGEDDRLCRTLAEELAGRAADNRRVREAVLHFKDGSERLLLKSDREKSAQVGHLFSRSADLLRRAVHGPPAYKRLSSRGETDVRIRGLRKAVSGPRELRSFPLPVAEGTVRADAVMNFSAEREISGLRREDRRRVASFSVRTAPLDPRRLRDELMPALTAKLPQGYSVEFDREALRRAEALSGIALRFLLAVLLCYMAVAAASESFTIPLAVLSVLPPSLAVPALFVTAAGYPVDASLACAFVAVAGMAVNASVLTAEELRRALFRASVAGFPTLYRALRRRLGALFATSATTVAGALPFLALGGAANAVVRSLALVTALGVGASFFCSLTLLPSLAVLQPSLFRTFSGSACAGSETTDEGKKP